MDNKLWATIHLTKKFGTGTSLTTFAGSPLVALCHSRLHPSRDGFGLLLIVKNHEEWADLPLHEKLDIKHKLLERFEPLSNYAEIAEDETFSRWYQGDLFDYARLISANFDRIMVERGQFYETI